MIKHRITAAAMAVLLVAGLAACGSSGHPSSSSSRTTTVTSLAADQVVIKNFAFTPATITVKAGTTVTWVDRDQVAHSVVADHNTFPSSPTLQPGDRYSHTFNTPGSFPYICGIHPYMTGTVVVSGS